MNTKVKYARDAEMMDHAMKFINGVSSLILGTFYAFFSQAMTQERRRYGFVLERQCSLAKHYASFHEVALAALHPSVDKWREVAATREYLPQSVEDMFASRLRVNSCNSLLDSHCDSIRKRSDLLLRLNV